MSWAIFSKLQFAGLLAHCSRVICVDDSGNKINLGQNPVTYVNISDKISFIMFHDLIEMQLHD